MILLDTHTLAWLDLEPERLGRIAGQRARAAWLVGELHVSVISFWEVAVLVRKRKLELAQSVRDWRAALLGAEIKELPLDGEVACLAEELRGVNRDPADRFIVATALTWRAPLLTADDDLLSWPGPLERIDARR